MSDTAAQDHVWRSLGRYPVRRAMLGREKADAITTTTLANLPTAAISAAGDDSAALEEIIRQTDRRVRAEYSERSGFAFLTILALWAISAIVQILVIRYWTNNKVEAAS